MVPYLIGFTIFALLTVWLCWPRDVAIRLPAITVIGRARRTLLGGWRVRECTVITEDRQGETGSVPADGVMLIPRRRTVMVQIVKADR